MSHSKGGGSVVSRPGERGKSKLGSVMGSEFGSQNGSDDEASDNKGGMEDEDYLPGPIHSYVTSSAAATGASYEEIFELSCLYLKYFVSNSRGTCKHPLLKSKAGPRNIFEVEQHLWTLAVDNYQMSYRLPQEDGTTLEDNRKKVALTVFDRLSESMFEDLDEDDIPGAHSSKNTNHSKAPGGKSRRESFLFNNNNNNNINNNNFPFASGLSTGTDNLKQQRTISNSSHNNLSNLNKQASEGKKVGSLSNAPRIDPDDFMRIGMSEEDDDQPKKQGGTLGRMFGTGNLS